jgi:hypothetical protein
MIDVKMNTLNMSDTEILDLFETSYSSQIAEINDIEDPEFEIERLVESGTIRISARLYGMAGSPTADTYAESEGIGHVSIYRADKGTLNFRYIAEETRPLGGNEYQVIYDSE